MLKEAHLLPLLRQGSQARDLLGREESIGDLQGRAARQHIFGVDTERVISCDGEHDQLARVRDVE